MKLSHNLQDLFLNHREIMINDDFNPAVSLVYSPAFQLAGALFDLETEQDPERIKVLERQCDEAGTFISVLTPQFADHQSVIDFVVTQSLSPTPQEVEATSEELAAMHSLGYTPAAIQAKRKQDQQRVIERADEQARVRVKYADTVRKSLTAWFKNHVSPEEIQEWWETRTNAEAISIIGALGNKINNIPVDANDKAGKIQQHTIAAATQHGYASKSRDPYKCAMYKARADMHERLATLYALMLEDVDNLFNTLLKEEGAGVGVFTPQTSEAQSEVGDTGFELNS